MAANPRKASGVFSRCSQPRRAAQLTAAGGVMERSPATTPMRNASKYGGICAFTSRAVCDVLLSGRESHLDKVVAFT